MCGICGIVHSDRTKPIDRHIIETMNRTMMHRGPDDEGYHLGDGAALAIRRLSIIDVEGGHQPMESEDGKIVSVCNGELYNFRELRKELIEKGHTFKTNSDSEILPHLYQEYGADLLAKLNGMFGLAIWDGHTRTLLVARDRMGQKPMYWTLRKGTFIFGSEAKAILAHPDIDPKPDRRALSKYLAYEYVPSPHSIYEGIFKLEAGHMLILKDGKVNVKQYWDVPTVGERSDITEDEAVLEIRRLLSESVKKRLISDVPLGVFLSGGLDSSSVTAMMKEHVSANQIKTFSIAFEERSFDESSYARQVANFFGTDHHEQLCTPSDLVKLLPKVTDFLDEPFADPSIIPTYALSRFTREYVTVALGGDGGDELFAGYPTYQADVYAKRYGRLPKFIRKGIVEPIVKRLPVSDENISFDFKAKRFIRGVDIEDGSRHMLWMGAFTPSEEASLLADPIPGDIFDDVSRYADAAASASAGNRILYLYKKTYLAEDILTKVDRASMGISLEARAPFLDHHFVEFVARLPYSMKLRGTTMKHILKRSFDPLLPKGIAGRAKKGFGIPVAKWVKGPLKEMVCDLFAEDRIRDEGFFKPEAVTKILKDHFEGRADNRKQIWTLLMFEQWLERWCE